MRRMTEPILIVGDCREAMKQIPSNSVDLICTSPPYNCKIEYDSWDDELMYEDYLKFMREWLTEAYRVLKDDGGRIAINLFYEISQNERGGRVFVASDVWQIMKEIGYTWNGVVRLGENQSERVKYTAWGSWKSASAPYIYNPEECVMLCAKDKWKKSSRGVSTMTRDEFMEAVKGVWPYRAETHNAKNPAPFSLDLPIRAVNILTYKDDVVLDPFCGRGTTGAACKILDRKFIGIDISQKYIDTARDEINRIASAHDIKRFLEFLGANGVVFKTFRESKEFTRYITDNVELIKPLCKFMRGINETFKDIRPEIRFVIKYTYDPECSACQHWSFIVKFPKSVSESIGYNDNFNDKSWNEFEDRFNSIDGRYETYSIDGGDIHICHDFGAETPLTGKYLADISPYA